MAVNERATAQIFLDGKQAEAAIDGLKVKATSLKQAIIEAGKVGDQATMKKLQSELKGVESTMRTMKKESFDVQKVLDNLSGASINDLNKAFQKLQSEMKRASRTDPGYKQLQADAKKLKAELNSVNNEMREQQGFLSKAADKFNNYFGVIGAGIAAMAGVGMTVQQAIDKANAREDTMGKVKALTDLGKAELDFLEQQAIQVATTVQTTVDGQEIRIQKSTDEILTAYQLVGSQKPELLKNKEALHAVTNEIMIMAEASEGLDLREAIGATTTAMNQYGAAANEAARFTNAMAAGAQVGAVEIPQIGEAIKDFGVNAKKANVPIEGSVALVEVLGEKAGLYGPQAGTQMRNFFSILSAGPKETNPEIVGLAAAMDNLAAKNMSSAEWVKMFGRENANTAQILVQNRGYVADMTTAIIGNNAAYKQAADNTADNNAKLTQAKTKAAEYAVEIGEKLAPAQLRIVSSGKLILMTISALIDLFKNHGTEILMVAGAIGIYTLGLKAQNAESKLSMALTKAKTIGETAYSTVVGVLTGKIKLAAVAQMFWNAVAAVNPFVALATGILLLTAGIVAIVKAMNAQTAAQKAVNDVTEEAKKSTQKQKDLTNDLLAVAKDEKRSLEDRKKALAELNKISPEYFGNLSIEKSTTQELTKAGEAYIKNLEKQALVKAAQNKIDKLRDENAQKQVDIEMKKTKWWETEAGAAKRRTKAINENKEAITELQKIVDANTDKTITTTVATETTNTTSDKPAGLSDEDKKKAQEKAYKDLDTWHQKELNAVKQQQLDKTITETKANELILQKDLEYLQKKAGLQKKFGDDYLGTEGEIIDKQLKAREDADKAEKERKKKEQDDAFKALDVEKEKELNAIRQQQKDKQLTEDEANILLIAKEVEYLQKKIDMRKQYGDETADLEAQLLKKQLEGIDAAAKADEKAKKELDDLKKKYADDEVTRQQELNDELAELDRITKEGALVTHEQYEAMKKKITEKYAKERFEKEKEYLNAASQIFAGVADYYEKRKQTEINKAGDDAKKKEAIEKKYAKKQQNIAIGQAFISGAQAVLELWSNKSVIPSPANEIYKGVMTGLIVANTAAQIGQIRSQQFATGGFTGGTQKYKPAGIVHEGEFVAAQETVNNPRIRPLLEYINFAQQNGTAASISLPAAVISTYGTPMPGYASGGFAPGTTSASGSSSTTIIQQQSDPEMKILLQQNAELLSHLKQNGVQSNINTQEIFKSQSDYDNNIRTSQF